MRKLPDCLEVAGGLFDIETDFRTWIQVGKLLEEPKPDWAQIACLVFTGESMPGDPSWAEQVAEFYVNKNATPHDVAHRSTARAYDYVEDGEYIVAAFQQAYGIDLTDESLKMHWHRFLALFRGLPGSTFMSDVMSARTWREDKRKHESIMQERKRIWSLPDGASGNEPDKARVLELFNERYS